MSPRTFVVLATLLADVPGLALEKKFFTMDEKFLDDPVNSLLVTVDEAAAGTSAGGLADQLMDGKPCIATIQEDDQVAIVMDVLNEQEVREIGGRIREILSA